MKTVNSIALLLLAGSTFIYSQDNKKNGWICDTPYKIGIPYTDSRYTTQNCKNPNTGCTTKEFKYDNGAYRKETNCPAPKNNKK